MSKYQPLSDRLGRAKGDDWRVSFADLETTLGFPLPKAARSGGSWWANDPAKAHNRAWLDKGWRVEAVDRKGEAVTFRRETAAQPPAMERAAEVASKSYQTKRAAGRTALLGGAVALVAGLGALALRAFRRRA